MLDLNNKTIEELTQCRDTIRLELKKRKNQQFVQDCIPILKTAFGKCYIYRDNRYGNDSPFWDVYQRVIDIVIKKDVCTLIVERFETTCYGNSVYEINNIDFYNNSYILGIENGVDDIFNGYSPISVKIYNAKRKAFFNRIKKQIKV